MLILFKTFLNVLEGSFSFLCFFMHVFSLLVPNPLYFMEINVG